MKNSLLESGLKTKSMKTIKYGLKETNLDELKTKSWLRNFLTDGRSEIRGKSAQNNSILLYSQVTLRLKKIFATQRGHF